MMKAIVTTFLFALVMNISHSQNTLFADSLKKALVNTTNEINQINILIKLSEFYQWSNPDSTILFGGQALVLAERFNIDRPKPSIYSSMMQALAMKGNFPKALELGFKSLVISKNLGDQNSIFWSLNQIGSIYFYARDYQKALNYFLISKPYLHDYRRDLKLHLGFIGEAYFHLNQIDSAFSYIKKAYDLDRISNSHWVIPYFYLGDIQLKKGNHLEALTYYRQGLSFSKAALDVVDGRNRMANLFKKTGLLDSAIYYAKLALKTAELINYKQGILVSTKELSDIYEPINTQESFRYFKMAATTKDSLFGTDNLQAMHTLMTQEETRQKDIENQRRNDLNKLKLYTLLASLAVMMLIGLILYRNNWQKYKANILLQEQKEKVEGALSKLKSTQAQLIQSEKLASLGELTAGIAHEIQNPLNFVNNFSELNREMIAEMKEEIEKGNYGEVKSIAEDLETNEERINHHGQRASSIVKSMLEHSRMGRDAINRVSTDINALADEYLRLAYHGLRAKDSNFNCKIETHFDPDLPKVSVIPQDIGRVLLNLINNAFYAVQQRNTTVETLHATSLQTPYQPTVTISTQKIDDQILIKVQDNGNGILTGIREKIFQPFFTTKPTGQGTGLGLSLAYDIVTKGHQGHLEVETKEKEGTEFTIILPVKTL